MTNQQKYLVVFKDIHNQMMVQTTVQGVSMVWIIANFSSIARELMIQFPPIKTLLENGEVCGVEVQLL
jgi:hypothetical protein